MRKTISFVVLILAPLFFEPHAQADDEAFVTEEGIGLQGYDPVAYFRAGQPVEGSSSFSTEYDGVVFQFSSSENQMMFE